MIEKPKKERRFLKTLGKIGEILLQEVLIKVGSSLIKKIGGKKTLPSILFLLASFSLFAQYPATGNKQRLGYQTTGDGLVFRARASDTTALKPSTINNAYFILDTVNNILYNYIKTKGGWQFSNGDTIIINGVTMPFDSIIFNTAKNGTVTVGEVEYNDTQGSLIQGLKGSLVTNVIGQQLHQRVNNRTGSTLAKGTAVYLSGSQGNRITVAKALATSDPTSANTFGIVAESIANNQSGYVITEGLITNINTSSLVEDSAVYLSPTVAGDLTSTKPQAPQHNVYIGVCVKSNAGSGELFVSIKNGLEITELHDVRITSPVDRASLYYKSSEALWRDTTAALLVSDTASMLNTYFRKSDTTSLNLTSRFAVKLNISDTASMLTNYLRSGIAASTYLTQSNAASTYQIKLTNPITGTGTTNYISKFTGTSSLGNSIIYDSGTNVGIGINSPNSKLHIYNNANVNLDNTNIDIETSGSTLGYAAQLRLINNNTNGRTYGLRSSGPGDTFLGSSNFGFVDYSANAVRMLINSSGDIGIGTITPNSKLDVRGSAIFNDDSGDNDFRIESDGNVNMVFVDASTDRVGIGTNAPTKTLEVNGTFNATGDITEGGLNVLTSSDTASMLIPYWRSGKFSGTLPIANGGTNATSASGARNNLDVDYVYFATTAGAAVSLTSNRVFIVNTGSFSTTTLDLTPATSGRTFMIKNLASGTVVSSASNVIPLNGGSASTDILSAGNVTPQWCTLVCDGTNWHIMQKN